MKREILVVGWAVGGVSLQKDYHHNRISNEINVFKFKCLVK